LELRQVRYIVAVVESLGFRKASNIMHVSQPSLSVQIKQLENELGVILFRRSKRHVEITRAGEAFLSAAREILLKVKQPIGCGSACGERRGRNDPARFYSNRELPYPSPASGQDQTALPLVNVELKEA
jgi:DNA-binding transcriptional LysR family regulator